MAGETDRIQKTILLRAPKARVWRALTDSAEFGSWFGVKFTAPFAPGATLRGTVTPTIADAEVARAQKAYEGFAFEIVVAQIEPERLFSFNWHPFAIEPDTDYSAEPMTLVTFELADEPGGVRLTITESGFDQIPLARRARAFAANEGGWAMQVKMVEQYLAQTL